MAMLLSRKKKLAQDLATVLLRRKGSVSVDGIDMNLDQIRGFLLACHMDLGKSPPPVVTFSNDSITGATISRVLPPPPPPDRYEEEFGLSVDARPDMAEDSFQEAVAYKLNLAAGEEDARTYKRFGNLKSALAKRGISVVEDSDPAPKSTGPVSKRKTRVPEEVRPPIFDSEENDNLWDD